MASSFHGIVQFPPLQYGRTSRDEALYCASPVLSQEAPKFSSNHGLGIAVWGSCAALLLQLFAMKGVSSDGKITF